MDYHLPLKIYQKKYAKKYMALFHLLRDEIMQERFSIEKKLPSERELARYSGLSRGTVRLVYEMLQADGLVESIPGIGYRVIPFGKEKKENKLILDKKVNKEFIPYLSDRSQRIPEPLHHRLGSSRKKLLDFHPAPPSGQLFPELEWKKSVQKALRELNYFNTTGTGHAAGYLPLREAIASHLRSRRGLSANADQIVIVNGSMQAIALLAHLLVNPGDQVIVEDPSYAGIEKAIRWAGGIPVFAPVDGNGLIPENWDSRLLFVTPTNQFPTGVALSPGRREVLIQWAYEKSSFIVEDDYDAEFRRREIPHEPLRMRSAEHVIYMGSFSRSISYHLRIGFVLLPEALTEIFLRLKSLLEPFSAAAMEQVATANFLQSGAYVRHVRRLTRIYRNRYNLLTQLIHDYFPLAFRPVSADTGLHLFAWWLGDSRSFEMLLQGCEKQGVRLHDGRSYFVTTQAPCAVFGFTRLQEEELKEAFRIAGGVAKKVLPPELL